MHPLAHDKPSILIIPILKKLDSLFFRHALCETRSCPCHDVDLSTKFRAQFLAASLNCHSSPLAVNAVQIEERTESPCKLCSASASSHFTPLAPFFVVFMPSILKTALMAYQMNEFMKWVSTGRCTTKPASGEAEQYYYEQDNYTPLNFIRLIYLWIGRCPFLHRNISFEQEDFVTYPSTGCSLEPM